MNPSLVDAIDFTDFYPQEQPADEDRSRPPAYNHHPQQQYQPRGRGGYQHTVARGRDYPHQHQPTRGAGFQGRGGASPRGSFRGGYPAQRGGGHYGAPRGASPSLPASGDYFQSSRAGPSSFLPIADAVPIQPPAYLVKDEQQEQEALASPKRAPVIHMVSRSIRRATAPPLDVNIFYGSSPPPRSRMCSHSHTRTRVHGHSFASLGWPQDPWAASWRSTARTWS
jgi:hypothetical protein